MPRPGSSSESSLRRPLPTVPSSSAPAAPLVRRPRPRTPLARLGRDASPRAPPGLGRAPLEGEAAAVARAGGGGGDRALPLGAMAYSSPSKRALPGQTL